jgi:hypothetical protein
MEFLYFFDSTVFLANHSLPLFPHGWSTLAASHNYRENDEQERNAL